MSDEGKKKIFKVSTLIFLIVIIVMCIYIADRQGYITIGGSHSLTLEEKEDILELNVEDNDYVTFNGKQIISLNADGIKAYSLEGEEEWSDTLSAPSPIIRQRDLYLAVTSKEGNSVWIFSDKARQGMITTDYPIIDISISESGGVAVIQQTDSSYIVSAYDETGHFIGERESYIDSDGYPVSAELSPNNKFLIISYILGSEPVLTSKIVAIDWTDENTKAVDNTKYGLSSEDNFVYEIEFISEDTWIAIGDQKITWYNLEGNAVAEKKDVYPTLIPYLNKTVDYGKSFFPMIATNSPGRSVVHREDSLIYYTDKGSESVTLNLEAAAEYMFANNKGVVVGLDGKYVGYNKLGNKVFEYKPLNSVNKVFYIPDKRKGIAISKEKVTLLGVKKGEK